MKKQFVLLTAILFISTSVFAQNTITQFPNIEFANINGRSLQLDLYIPNNQTMTTPLIIWVHGGGWRVGTRSLGINSFQLSQARHGYAVASIDYRLSDEAKFPTQIHDVKTAIRWLKANASTYNINPNKVAIWGSSAGGHLAALAGTSGAVSMLEDFSTGNADQNSKVQAVLDLYGPTDFLQVDANAHPCSDTCHSCVDSAESLLIGCPLFGCRAKVRRADPLRYIDPDFERPVFLIIHGSEDCTVPTHQSQILHEKLISKGFNSTLMILQGAGHGGPAYNTPQIRAVYDDFFDTHLRNNLFGLSELPQNNIILQNVSQSLFGQFRHNSDR